jgi:site-specific recombinase XerD
VVAVALATARIESLESLQSRAVESCLTSLAPASRRVYAARIRDYLAWSRGAPLDREHVQRYMRALELAAASPQVRNQALAALKKLATEAAELSWIEHAAAAQIGRIKARRITGIRSGKWLTRDQAQRLLTAPDRTTVQGRRDSVVLALLLGCGLRRDEAVRLTAAQCVAMDGRMVLRNVEGKGGRIRSVSVPKWAQRTITEWVKETDMNKPEKCSVCGRRRVIVHVVDGGGHDDGDRYCRQCEADYQGQFEQDDEATQ